MRSTQSTQHTIGSTARVNTSEEMEGQSAEIKLASLAELSVHLVRLQQPKPYTTRRNP